MAVALLVVLRGGDAADAAAGHFFIRKGIPRDECGERRKKFSVWTLMQRGYVQRAIALAMRHKAAGPVSGAVWQWWRARGCCVSSRSSSFPRPSATSSSLICGCAGGNPVEATDEAGAAHRSASGAEPLVASYARLSAAAAPRFYYNVNPEFAGRQLRATAGQHESRRRYAGAGRAACARRLSAAGPGGAA